MSKSSQSASVETLLTEANCSCQIQECHPRQPPCPPPGLTDSHKFTASDGVTLGRRIELGVIGKIPVWPGGPLRAGLYFVDWLTLGSTNHDVPTHQNVGFDSEGYQVHKRRLGDEKTVWPTTS